MNIEYIYWKVSNSILKKWFISCEHRVYILKGFKFYTEKILYYPFKLKYLNKFFLSHLKKT
jgi:hypothetical protein